MKFSVNQETIQKVFKKLGNTIAKNDMLVILQGVCIHVVDDEVTFVSSDGTNSIKTSINSEDDEDLVIEETGSVIFPQKAVSMIDKLKGLITFQVDERDYIQITYQSTKKRKGNFEIPAWNADEFPTFANTTEEPLFSVSAKDFSEAIRKVSFAAAVNESRPILQAVYLQVAKQGLALGATDSHRLAFSKCFFDEGAKSKEELAMPVTAKVLDKMAKVFDPNDTLEVYVNGSQFSVKSRKDTYFTRIMEGKYPDVMKLLQGESNAKQKITFNRLELLEVLEQLEALTSTKESKGIAKLSIDGMFAKLEGKGGSGDLSKGEVDIAFSNNEGDENISILFAISNLIQPLKALNTEEVRLSLTAPQVPIFVDGINQQSMTPSKYILSPVKEH